MLQQMQGHRAALTALGMREAREWQTVAVWQLHLSALMCKHILRLVAAVLCLLFTSER